VSKRQVAMEKNGDRYRPHRRCFFRRAGSLHYVKTRGL